METPWISIIIPAYNPSLNLLKNCIESVHKLEIPKEIILVDDGSEDDVKGFCQKFTKEEIHYIRQENQGVSKARMVGIGNARGMYIFFLDADDSIPVEWCDFINSMYTTIKEDWILFDAIDFFYKSGRMVKRNAFTENRAILTRKRALGYVLKNAKLNECWGKLIRRDFIEKNYITFPEGVAQAEDLIFNYRVICKAESIVAYDIPAYIYRYDIKNTARLLRDYLKYFSDMKQVYQEGVKAIEWCFDTENEKAEQKIKLVRGRIDELGSDVVKLAAAGRWTSREKTFIRNWIDDTELLKGISINDIQKIKCRIYFILLKYKIWSGFRFLGCIKRMENRENIL